MGRMEKNGYRPEDYRPRDRMAELEDGLVEVAGMGAEADERIAMLEDALVELAAIIGGDE